MKTVDMAKATAPLAEYAQNLRRDPVILTREGRPVAALVLIKDVDWDHP